ARAPQPDLTARQIARFRSEREAMPILRILVPVTEFAALAAGMATSVGSLPHRDAHTAATSVLRCLPELPAAPQLPRRTPLEGIVAQWACAIEGVDVLPDGTLALAAPLDPLTPVHAEFRADAHSGLLTFLDVAARQPRPPVRVKL